SYPMLSKKGGLIVTSFGKEEEKFKKTLEEGLKKSQEIFDKKTPIEVEKYAKIMQAKGKKEIFRRIYRKQKIADFPLSFEEIQKATISGKEAFDLYQSWGFPIEMIIELAQEKNLFVDIEEYEEELKKHQNLSRTSSAGMFKGGLADSSEIVTKYHTATHLLQAALREVLGPHIFQKGSNITSERLRFDFSHPQKLTEEELKNTEYLVNQKITENLPVTMETMTLDKAQNKGALSVFKGKDEDKVKVYSIGSPSSPAGESGSLFSREICGGPHADFTGSLGKFKIIKEDAASSGVRRVYAVLE
ncbi:MAG: alanine--tRNA ligase-related protein, partial [Candidatus Curtissbacteria bacterium]|nr:alanine--tRNA ligase-related protein [Candidatus Curtissbacteria bacterium]